MNGRAHHRVATGGLIAGAAVGISHHLGLPVSLTLTGMGLAVYITPDYDVDHQRIHPLRVIGGIPLLGSLWKAYWLPYAKTHEHRGPSHEWPIGTLVRMAWTLWWLPLVTLDPTHYLALFIGWSAIDLTHVRDDGGLDMERIKNILIVGVLIYAAVMTIRHFGVETILNAIGVESPSMSVKMDGVYEQADKVFPYLKEISPEAVQDAAQIAGMSPEAVTGRGVLIALGIIVLLLIPSLLSGGKNGG